MFVKLEVHKKATFLTNDDDDDDEEEEEELRSPKEVIVNRVFIRKPTLVMPFITKPISRSKHKHVISKYKDVTYLYFIIANTSLPRTQLLRKILYFSNMFPKK